MNRARRPERPGVIALCKDATLALETAIDGSRQPHRQALHASRECSPIARFGDQVEVIALHGEVHEAEAETLLAVRERKLNSAKQLFQAQ